MSTEILRVPVYYDFASTLCYVAHRVMGRMADELHEMEIELCWRPVDLTQITGWPRGAPMEGLRRQNALRVARELEVAVRIPTHWLDLRWAGSMALSLAESDGAREAAWRERVFCALHEEGRDLEAPDAQSRLARDLRLGAELQHESPSLAALDEETRGARADEVTGVPTFMLNRWPFGGIQTAATMGSLLRRWARKQRASD
jgi:predicted DsbA family dithiol-disulfide isomerase